MSTQFGNTELNWSDPNGLTNLCKGRLSKFVILFQSVFQQNLPLRWNGAFGTFVSQSGDLW